jgi:hypothetical protein
MCSTLTGFAPGTPEGTSVFTCAASLSASAINNSSVPTRKNFVMIILSPAKNQARRRIHARDIQSSRNQPILKNGEPAAVAAMLTIRVVDSPAHAAAVDSRP